MKRLRRCRREKYEINRVDGGTYVRVVVVPIFGPCETFTTLL